MKIIPTEDGTIAGFTIKIYPRIIPQITPKKALI